jgi:hypothetical protein
LRRSVWSVETTVQPIDWLANAFPDRSWRGAQVRFGAFHDVVLREDVVARLTHGGEHGSRSRREHAALRTVQDLDLGVRVPHVLTDIVTENGRTGYLTSRVPGNHDSPIEWGSVARQLREDSRSAG